MGEAQCWACDKPAGNGYTLSVSPLSSPTVATLVVVCYLCLRHADEALRHRRCRSPLLPASRATAADEQAGE